MLTSFAHAIGNLSKRGWNSFIALKKTPLKTEQRLPDPVLDTVIGFLNIPDVWNFSLTNKDLATRMHARKHNYNEVHHASRFIALYVRRLLSGSVTPYQIAELIDIQQKFNLQNVSTSHCERFYNPHITMDPYKAIVFTANLKALNTYDHTVVKNCRNLRVLQLQESEVTDQDLSELTVLTHLEELVFKKCHYFAGNGLSCLNHADLHSLDISGLNSITDMGLSALSTLKLHKLNLSSCPYITDIGLQALAHMPLFTLSLGYLKNATDAGLQFLSSLKTLQELDIRHFTDGAMQHLTRLDRLQKLTVCNISDVGLVHVIQCTQLEELHFVSNGFLGDRGARITDKGLSMLSACSNLQALTFVNCDAITEDGPSFLTSLTRLKKLVVHDCKAITTLFRLNTLEVLPYLEKLDFYEQSARLVRPSSGLMKLKELRCTSSDVRALSHLTNLQALELWTLRYEDITEENVDFLIKLPLLRTITIIHCRDLRKMLNQLDKLPQLRTLNLSYINHRDITIGRNRLVALRYVQTLILGSKIDLSFKKKLRKRFEIIHQAHKE